MMKIDKPGPRKNCPSPPVGRDKLVPPRRIFILALSFVLLAALAAKTIDRAIDRGRLNTFIQGRLGIPYCWGGCTERGFDCSGFVMRAFQDQGINLPRHSYLQSLCGEKIGPEKLGYGDLLFFDTKGQGKVTHVGIHLENKKFAHAASSKGISFASLNDKYWGSRFLFSNRITREENHLKKSEEKLAALPEAEKQYDLKEAYIVGLEGFLSQEEALKYQSNLLSKGYDAFITYEKSAEGKDIYRVGIGFFNTEKEAANFIMKDDYIQGLVYFIIKQKISSGDGV